MFCNDLSWELSSAPARAGRRGSGISGHRKGLIFVYALGPQGEKEVSVPQHVGAHLAPLSDDQVVQGARLTQGAGRGERGCSQCVRSTPRGRRTPQGSARDPPARASCRRRLQFSPAARRSPRARNPKPRRASVLSPPSPRTAERLRESAGVLPIACAGQSCSAVYFSISMFLTLPQSEASHCASTVLWTVVTFPSSWVMATSIVPEA